MSKTRDQEETIETTTSKTTEAIKKTLQEYRIFLIAGAILLVAVLGLVYVQMNHSGDNGSEQIIAQQEITSYANTVAEKLGALFIKDIAKLHKLSEERITRAVLKDFDQKKAKAFAKKYSKRFENSIGLRILPADTSETDKETVPLTFAALDMVLIALKKKTQIPVEWHFPSQESESILLVQRVNNKQGDAIGALLLSLAVDPVYSLFDKITNGEKAFTELLQETTGGGSTELISVGNKKRAATGQLATTAVANTRWLTKVKSYPPPVIEKTNLFKIVWLILVAAGAGLLFWIRKFKLNKKPVKEVRRTKVANVSKTADVEEYLTKVPEIEVDEVEKTFSPEQLKEEILTAGDEKEVADIESTSDEIDEATNAPASIFRAYDIRGVVGQTLTEQIVYNIGRALGSEAYARGDNTVVVGRDGRLSSPSLSAALIKGLTESGRDVIDIGMVPTPVLYFGANFFETRSGIMITGSHNPPDYNGIKMVLAGTTLADEAIQALRQRILTNDYTTGEGSNEAVEIGAEYVRRITDDIPVAITNSFKVVVDAGNGVAGQLGPQLIRALGHDVVELFCEIDGNFPNHHPDPSQPENLVELINTVKSEGADLGFAFDGDGDRLGVVDRDGNVIWPDRQMMLFACDVLERNPGCEILFDVKCSNHLQRVIEEAGGKATMWKTGHSLIKGKMKESGALLAGEMSGHVFFKERWYGFDDGLYTAARLLEILVKADQPPHEILGALPGGVATPELKLEMHEDQHKAFMVALIEIADFGDGKIGTIDGIRVDFSDGWGLIRPSNTTPCLVMRFEADNPEALQRVQDLFKAQLLALDSTLKLPF